MSLRQLGERRGDGAGVLHHSLLSGIDRPPCGIRKNCDCCVSNTIHQRPAPKPERAAVCSPNGNAWERPNLLLRGHTAGEGESALRLYRASPADPRGRREESSIMVQFPSSRNPERDPGRYARPARQSRRVGRSDAAFGLRPCCAVWDSICKHPRRPKWPSRRS